jgi:hypothetical protein
MIVVMVHRPETADGDTSDPFDGVEIYGMYYEAEEKYVMEMIDDLTVQHPDWHFNIDPHVKSYVGFHPDRLKVPKQAGRNKE